MCKQLELASEHEFDLGGTEGLRRKWLVDFSAGKTQLVSIAKTELIQQLNDLLYKRCLEMVIILLIMEQFQK